MPRPSGGGPGGNSDLELLLQHLSDGGGGGYDSFCLLFLDGLYTTNGDVVLPAGKQNQSAGPSLKEHPPREMSEELKLLLWLHPFS